MIRNYRQLTRVDSSALAMGISRAKVIRDSIVFKINREEFAMGESFPVHIIDTLLLNFFPVDIWQMLETIEPMTDSITIQFYPEYEPIDAPESLSMEAKDAINISFG